MLWHKHLKYHQEADDVTEWLPWPPSVNTYWRHPNTGKLAGRHLISEKGRSYRKEVAIALRGQKPIEGPVWVEILAFPPDKRRRDLDNLLKAILDAVQYAGVLKDDSQIHDLRICWGKGSETGIEFTAGQL